jgi:putative nucleotidyltransferase with HDIG domain
MNWFRRVSRRREEIRRNRPDQVRWSDVLRSEGIAGSLVIAGVFVVMATAILLTRPEVISYRPGQFLRHDVVSRVDFSFYDADRHAAAQQVARDAEPRVYAATEDVLSKVEEQLITLPQRVAGLQLEQLPEPLRSVLDGASLAKLHETANRHPNPTWEESVRAYMSAVRKLDLVILPDEQRAEEVGRMIRLPGRGTIRGELAFSISMSDELSARLNRPASEAFSSLLFPKIVRLTLAMLKPTHELDEAATAAARNAAADRVPEAAGMVVFRANQELVRRGEIDQRDWRLLRAENEAFRATLSSGRWLERLGLFGAVLLLTLALCGYIVAYQPRIVRNHARGVGLAALMLSMLLLAQLAGIGSNQLHLFATAPTVLVAMIIAIAYDQRFALGVGGIHAVLVTLGLGESLSFFMVLWLGVMVACYLLDDVRSRDKLVRVGGGVSVALALGTVVSGLLASDPPAYILRNAVYAGAAGMAAGFIVLGILPFIEKAFRITTSMTLLELADVSHPLLRRLAAEAPGTWSHSLNVAALAEEAAEAVGANSLLCRVGAYYHDVGKINKADYFIENQQGGASRHLNLSPSVSLLIIVGHVKDGLELAREYNLPTVLNAFIQQHHGTTLVEFFYREALSREQAQPVPQTVSETQYRYPGPKPRSRETAILMICDAVESACRAMPEPSATRIESIVHEIAIRRLLDGQFDECDLTMRELELIERSVIRTLLGIYHGRIAYPSTRALTQGAPAAPAPGVAEVGQDTLEAQSA